MVPRLSSQRVCSNTAGAMRAVSSTLQPECSTSLVKRSYLGRARASLRHQVLGLVACHASTKQRGAMAGS